MGAGLSAAGFAGCLGNADNENAIEYEQCGKRVIPIRELPAPAEDEVMIALEEGEYESDNSVILPDVMDIDESYLSSDGSFVYYTVVVERDETVTRLQLERDYPSTSATASILNALEDDVTAEVHIENKATDEILVSETIELKADEEVEFNGDIEYRYGRYNAEFTITKNGSKRSETVSWSDHEYIGPYPNYTIQTFSEEGMLSWEAGDHHDPLPCEWNDNGELIEGPTAS